MLWFCGSVAEVVRGSPAFVAVDSVFDHAVAGMDPECVSSGFEPDYLSIFEIVEFSGSGVDDV